MKKIIALVTLAIMSITSGFATVGESTTINSDDLLKANIFYINGQGYIKENNKLKKIQGIDFYSIAGQRYIKKDGKITKVIEDKIFKINNINYVKSNGKLTTLDKYLAKNEVKKNQDSKNTINNSNIKISEKKLALIKKQTINKLLKTTYLVLNDGINTKEEINIMQNDLRNVFISYDKKTIESLNQVVKEFKNDKEIIEMGKNLKILENINNIKPENIKDEENKTNEDFSFEGLLNEITTEAEIVTNDEIEAKPIDTVVIKENTQTGSTLDNSEESSDDEDLEKLFGDLFKDL